MKYSITPEGAKSAAEEVKLLCEQEVGEYLSKHKAIIKVSALQINVDFLAAIILRHAEQSQAISKKDLLRLRAIANEISDEGHNGWGNEIRQIVFRQLEATESVPQSPEGEMREACIVCGCALMPPERTEPPHCMDCALTDEHYYAWEAGKGV